VTVLDRLAPVTTTGIGSLPFDTVDEAVEQACGAYELPFCPQLPRRDGDMVEEWLGADPARCGWSAERDRERPHAWDAFLARVTARPPEHRVVKLQVTGPLTLAVALEPSAPAAAPDLAREIAAWLAAAVAGQVRALDERGLATLLVVDEPALAAVAPTPAAAVAGGDPLRAVAPAWGLHVCCAVPWDVVERAEADVVGFDVARHGVDRRAATALERLLRRDGRIAWGVLSVDRDEGVADGAQRLSHALAAVAARGLGVDVVLTRSLVTPACGTGIAPPARERGIAAALDAVSGAGRSLLRAAATPSA
jgi:methionine synthase II (cobalamin-independent)